MHRSEGTHHLGQRAWPWSLRKRKVSKILGSLPTALPRPGRDKADHPENQAGGNAEPGLCLESPGDTRSVTDVGPEDNTYRYGRKSVGLEPRNLEPTRDSINVNCT